MRAILLVLILAVVAIIAAIATGFVDINQVRGAKAPDIDVTSNGVSAQGGQTPTFDVDTGSVAVGAGETTVKVPVVKVNPAGNVAEPAQAQTPAPPPTKNTM